MTTKIDTFDLLEAQYNEHISGFDFWDEPVYQLSDLDPYAPESETYVPQRDAHLIPEGIKFLRPSVGIPTHLGRHSH